MKADLARSIDVDEQEAAMQRVTQGQFIDELNARLRAHEDFVPGMRFVTSPPGSAAANASGYSWEPDFQQKHPFTAVAHDVMRSFTT